MEKIIRRAILLNHNDHMSDLWGESDCWSGLDRGLRHQGPGNHQGPITDSITKEQRKRRACSHK